MRPDITTSTDKTSQAEMRLAAVLGALLAISLMVTIASGIWMNTEWHEKQEMVRQSLKTWHMTSGLVFIVAGCLHIWVNRWWYVRLLQTEPRDWYGVAQFRLMPIFTMLFAAVAMTGILIAAGLDGLISFHQGCGLLLGVFAIGHIASRMRALMR